MQEVVMLLCVFHSILDPLKKSHVDIKHGKRASGWKIPKFLSDSLFSPVFESCLCELVKCNPVTRLTSDPKESATLLIGSKKKSLTAHYNFIHIHFIFSCKYIKTAVSIV